MNFTSRSKIFLGVVILALIAGLGIWYMKSREEPPRKAIPINATIKNVDADYIVLETYADYKNAPYIIEGQEVTLIDGMAEGDAEVDSVSKVTTEYFGNEASGDLNGDGVADRAFLLAQYGAGTGVFFYAAAAIRVGEKYSLTNTVFLGDRIAPQTSRISNAQFVVNYAERAPGEPMTAEPTVGVSKYLKLEDDKLVVIR